MRSPRLPAAIVPAALAGAVFVSPAAHAQEPGPACSPEVVRVSDCKVFPAFRGCTRRQAERWLGECGYDGRFPTEEAFNPLPAGTISTQSAPPGPLPRRDGYIVFFLSIGPDPAAATATPSAADSPGPELTDAASSPATDGASTAAATGASEPTGDGSATGAATDATDDSGGGPAVPWWDGREALLALAGLAALVGLAWVVRRLLVRPTPQVDCSVRDGATRLTGLEPGSVTPPPAAIEVALQAGQGAVSPLDFETLESADE